MASKNFSILYSSSASNSSENSKSKSKTKSNALKSKSNALKSKSKSKRNTSKNKIKRRTLGELLNVENIPQRPKTVKYSKHGKENRSWRKRKKELLSLKKTRDNISSLLSKKKWTNKINGNDIISIKYYPVEEMHIHLYEINNKLSYHVKAKFPLNNWQLLLQYNVKTNDYDFVIKNNTNTVLMRENWKNKNVVIEKLKEYSAINMNNKDANDLLEKMLNITTIIESIVKQHIMEGGYRKQNKTKRKNKRRRKNKTKRNKKKKAKK